MEKRKVSTFLANEEKKRLLKSGKDNLHRLFFKDDHLLKKDDRVLLKRRSRLKKTRWCLVNDENTCGTATESDSDSSATSV
jgi:isopentenyldiphosphate isomerase